MSMFKLKSTPLKRSKAEVDRIAGINRGISEVGSKGGKVVSTASAMTQVYNDESKALATYGDFLVDVEAGETPASKGLMALGDVDARLGLLMAEMAQSLEEKLLEPLAAFSREELSAAAAVSKKKDRLKKDFDSADSKFRKQRTSVDERKSFNLENDRNRLEREYNEACVQSQEAEQHALRHNQRKVVAGVLQVMEGYLQSLEAAKEMIEAAKASLETDEEVQDVDDSHTGDVWSGWVRIGPSVRLLHQRYVVLKPKLLLVYAGHNEALKESIALNVGCAMVDPSDEKGKTVRLELKTQQYIIRMKEQTQTCAFLDYLRKSIEEYQDVQAALMSEVIPKEEEKKGRMLSTRDITKLDTYSRCVHEFILAEKVYTKKVGKILKMYAIPLNTEPGLRGYVTPSQLEMMFGNLRPLVDFQRDFYEELEESDELDVGAIFLRHSEEMQEVYINYVKDLASSLYALDILMRSTPKVQNFLNRIQMVMGQGNDLRTLLARPVSKISDYRAFLEGCIHEQKLCRTKAHEQDPNLARAAEIVVDMCKQVSEASIYSSAIAKVSEISEKLVGFPGSLVGPRRTFRRECDAKVCMQVDGASEMQHLMLFSDVLVFSKVTRKELRYVDHVEMFRVRDATIEGGAVTLRCGSKKSITKSTIVITFSDLLEGQSWNTLLNDVIHELDTTSKVFGVSMEDLMSGERETGRLVPKVVEQLCSWVEQYGLECEGVFRLPGRLDDIQAYKDQYNTGKDVVLDKDVDYRIVTGLITHFLMEMPEPIMTHSLYASFIAVAKRHGEEEEALLLEELKELVNTLPEYHRHTLSVMVKMMVKITGHEATTKMGSKNLAIVFGPSLLSAPDDGLKALGMGAALGALGDFAACYWVVEQLIVHFDDLLSMYTAVRPHTKKPLPSPRGKPLPTPGSKPLPSPGRARGRGRGRGTRGSGRGRTMTRRESNLGADRDGPPRGPAPLPPKDDEPPKRLPPKPGGSTRGPRIRRSQYQAEDGQSDVLSDMIGMGEVLKEGYLRKKGEKRRNWTTRWCVLTGNGQLTYYKEKKDVKAKGIVFVNNATFGTSNHKAYCFTVSTSERVWFFEARDDQDRNEWIQCLHKAKSEL